jgi:hypothetical protein
MNKAMPPRKLKVGDRSGKWFLESISEYKVDTKGYILTWSTPRGLRVYFMKANDFVGIDGFARYQ